MTLLTEAKKYSKSEINNLTRSFGIAVIGTSAGGNTALETIFSVLDKDILLPIIVVQHLHKSSDSFHISHLREYSGLNIVEATDKDIIEKGHIYFAPPDYHLLVNQDRTLSLSLDALINFSRPSIDILFESCAYSYRENCIGIILTGSNSDGAVGMAKIKAAGGIAVVQSPESAEFMSMPQAAVRAAKIDQTMTLEQIGEFLNSIVYKES